MMEIVVVLTPEGRKAVRIPRLLMASKPYMSVATAAERRPRISGSWTIFGTWVLMFVYALMTHGFSDLFSVAGDFFTGDLEGARAHSTLMRMAPMIAATVVIMVPVITQLTVPIVHAVHKMKGEHANTSLFVTQAPKEQFRATMIALYQEEVFARLLFLGTLTQIPGLRGTFGFYLLVLLGNLSFGLIHWTNFKDKADRKLIMVLPQFVGGLFLTLVYIPYGFFGALMAHVIFDMVLFAGDRKDVFNLGEILLCVYHALGLAFSSYMFIVRNHNSLLDIKQWFVDQSSGFALTGWTFWDYMWCIIMVTSGVSLIAELLLYDREGGMTFQDALKDWATIGLFPSASFILVMGLQNEYHGNVMIIIFAMAMVASFGVKSASGSGVARVFWESLLIISLLISSIMALGPHSALYLIIGYVLYLLPDRIIRFYDKDELPSEPASEQVPAAAAAVKE